MNAKFECEACAYEWILKDEIYWISNNPCCPKCGSNDDVIHRGDNEI